MGPARRKLSLPVFSFYGGMRTAGWSMPSPSPAYRLCPPRVGGRGEEEGHPEWRGSDTCGPIGVGAGLRRRPGGAGAAESSLQARPRPGSCAGPAVALPGPLTQGSHRQPLPTASGRLVPLSAPGLHDSWEEDEREFMPSAEAWAGHPVCARVSIIF